jgi:hypothetical protein
VVFVVNLIRSVKNQYRGVNAHLHSYWQNRGGWNSFHGNHIADLMRLLNTKLIPMGYSADFEPSLQIRRLDKPVGEPESDVTVFDLDPIRPGIPSKRLSDSDIDGLLVIPAVEWLSELPISEKRYNAIAIYEGTPTRRDLGEPIAWIELLSPSNKIHSRDKRIYQMKRSKIVRSGIVFVELDYLHESPPTSDVLARYRPRLGQSSSDAYPYRIAVIDPRPRLEVGKVYIGQFSVDDSIPTMPIPLNADDVLRFDFGVPYGKTLEETQYGFLWVDYSELPLRFERYSHADQTRIARRMLAVLEAKRDGVDLETGPFPVKEVTLEEALQQIEALKKEL